ncbi:MAG: alpha/beta hydrolase [Oscillospiraceae bacterium]|jgi:acetyl esterase/lipase|nr:alpha/beta hydrolase [Oscillospiraceae bacterium]
MKRIDWTIGTCGADAVGYLHEHFEEMANRQVRPCVVVCPGGGYQYCSRRENEPVAAALFAAGFHVFVLTYSVGEQAANLQPLSELAALVAQIRRQHEALNIDPEKIAVMGFSAGGHLAGSLGTLWHHAPLLQRIGATAEECRPDAMILCYPVLMAGKLAHRGSIQNVTGGDAALLELLSLENQVRADTPPAFLWHTATDGSVPVENTLVFASALQENGVPFEAHVFATGGHGLSLCNEEVNTPHPANSLWFPLLLNWLEGTFDFRR